jgi:hypothetical protein
VRILGKIKKKKPTKSNAFNSVLTIEMECEGCHNDRNCGEKVKEGDLVVQVR